MEHAKPKIELQKKPNFLIVLFLTFGCYSFCFSQSKFFPGYILTLSGDTLKGELRDQGEIENAQLILFKENESEKEHFFTPTEIRAFYISNGNYYESSVFKYLAEIPIKNLELIANTSKESSNRSAYEIKTDTAFLRLVVYGNAKLYIHAEKNGNYMYFIETPSGGLKHLKDHKTYYSQKNGNIKFKTQYTIKDTLLKLTSDCQKSLAYESRSRIYLTDLINVVFDYNKCIGSESKIIQPKLNPKIKFGLSTGMSRSNVQFKESELYWKGTQYDYAPRYSYMIGLFVDWYLYNPKENWAIQTELSYNQKGANPKDYIVHSYTIKYVGMPADTIHDSVSYRINTKYIDLSFSGKYYINDRTKTIRPYISLGIIAGVLLNKDYADEEIHFAGEKSFYPAYNFPELEAGIEGKAGILLTLKKNFSFYTEIKSNYSRPISSGNYYNMRSILYGLSIGIYI